MPNLRVNWSITVSGTHIIEDVDNENSDEVLEVLEEEWRELVSESSGYDSIAINAVEVLNA